MPHRRPWVALAPLLLALLVLAGACSDSGEGASATTTARPKPPLTYVAVGASETVGTGADKPLTEGWTRVLANGLGQNARQVTFTNLGVGGATVADALASAVPKAEQLAPNLVTVWLNANDIIGEFLFPAVATYEQKLGELVRRLRRGGATTVLVANTPALDRLPLYLDCLNAAGTLCPSAFRRVAPKPEAVIAKVDAFNRSIAAVAQAEGAIVVDLHAASLKAREAGNEASLVSGDGFHPSTAGHAAVAAAFAEAAEKAGI